ncbi:MAG TPA: hypothetical protein VMH81_20490 [Bryobacteraceae bacterium]|nr:hypothetical protein [Bryobacteraceae bacterium]
MNAQVLAYLPLLSPIATLVVVVLGVFFSNHHVDVRITDLRAHMDGRFNSMDQLFQERLRRVEEVMDARLSRIEQELHLK